MAYKKLRLILALQFIVLNVTFAQSSFPNPLAIKRDDGSIIHYYLHVKSNGEHTRDLLVLLQGSDCNSVCKSKGINKLKNIYPDVDLLTVEKYGITEELRYSNDAERPDCPDRYIEHDNPIQRVSDLDRVITILRDKYTYGKVIVIGGSEGSLVATMLTAKTNYIDATVLIASGGRFFLDDAIHSMKFTIPSEEDLHKNIDGFTQFARNILSNEPFEVSMSNHGYLWWHTMLSTDQEGLLRDIETPVLILQGGGDESASPEKATEMVESLREKGKHNIDYYFYPEYNHSLHLSDEDDLSEKVINDIKNWLRKNNWKHNTLSNTL